MHVSRFGQGASALTKLDRAYHSLNRCPQSLFVILNNLLLVRQIECALHLLSSQTTSRHAGQSVSSATLVFGASTSVTLGAWYELLSHHTCQPRPPSLNKVAYHFVPG